MLRALTSAVALLAMVSCSGGKKKSAAEEKRHAFTRYAPEAKQSLARLVSNVKTYYETTAELPGPAPLTPPLPDCRTSPPPHRHQPDAALWYGNPAWDAVDFAQEEAHVYSYQLDVSANQFSAIALGDLDCDATLGSYTLAGTLQNGELVMSELVDHAAGD